MRRTNYTARQMFHKSMGIDLNATRTLEIEKEIIRSAVDGSEAVTSVFVVECQSAIQFGSSE